MLATRTFREDTNNYVYERGLSGDSCVKLTFMKISSDESKMTFPTWSYVVEFVVADRMSIIVLFTLHSLSFTLPGATKWLLSKPLAWEKENKDRVKTGVHPGETRGDHNTGISFK